MDFKKSIFADGVVYKQLEIAPAKEQASQLRQRGGVLPIQLSWFASSRGRDATLALLLLYRQIDTLSKETTNVFIIISGKILY